MWFSNDFIRIKLGRKTINRVNYIKYLGVLVDSTLSWKPYIVELTKKLSRNVEIFFKIKVTFEIEFEIREKKNATFSINQT